MSKESTTVQTKKPYAFAETRSVFTSKAPIWHDGSSSAGTISGELRCEIETLTPLLVGWERRQLDEQDAQDPWKLAVTAMPRSPELDALLETAALQAHPDSPGEKERALAESRQKYKQERLDKVVKVIVDGEPHTVVKSKSLLYPLRLPDDGPVLIPGDSLKGLLRHELGALLGAPMERVAERTYSYRPNAKFTQPPGARLVARIARVPEGAVEERLLVIKEGGKEVGDSARVRVPTKLELFPLDLKYDKKGDLKSSWYRFDAGGQGLPYRGGQGAGERLNATKGLHRSLATSAEAADTQVVDVPSLAIEGYLQTLQHLIDTDDGHFSERHPDVPKVLTAERARARLRHAATDVVFEPGDAIWVEWDIEKKCIVSFGWHYYYRWRYQDSVRRRGRGRCGRPELLPTEEELDHLGDGSPRELTAVRRLFGYTGDNEGSKGIGDEPGEKHGDHSQLMGRLSINAAIEIVTSETNGARFLRPTYLKELGQPKPSAVEHYLKQPHAKAYGTSTRPSDAAQLVTYGDAEGYDEPGELAGRKFYLDRSDAYGQGSPWEDCRESNRLNDRSTLAIGASTAGRRFRFTLRFRDLEPAELAAVMLALCPDQLAKPGPSEEPKYCSKLGYARPLGWGSVVIRVKELHLLRSVVEAGGLEMLSLEQEDVTRWFEANRPSFDRKLHDRWLGLHRCKHPDAGDYPRKDGQIFTYHTQLRAQHSRQRRYRRPPR